MSNTLPDSKEKKEVITLTKKDKKEIVDFLKANGFIKTDSNLWANNYCSVEITEDQLGVCNNTGDVIYSDTTSIFWLVGVLTWYGAIDKYYKKY